MPSFLDFSHEFESESFLEWLFWVPTFYWSLLRDHFGAVILAVTAVGLGLPCAALVSQQMWRNREEVSRLAGLAKRAARDRAPRALRRAVGGVLADAVALPGLVLYATGVGLADVSGAGPRVRRLGASLAADVAALPEALAAAVLDAVGALHQLNLSALPAALLRDAAAFPLALSEALGATALLELVLDSLRSFWTDGHKFGHSSSKHAAVPDHPVVEEEY
jgi:hypothetical protein